MKFCLFFVPVTYTFALVISVANQIQKVSFSIYSVNIVRPIHTKLNINILSSNGNILCVYPPSSTPVDSAVNLFQHSIS